MFTIDTAATRAGLATLGAGIMNAAAQALEQGLRGAETHAKATRLFKDQSGATRQSIRHTRFQLAGTVTASGASHWLEYGTKPHTIAARRAKMLRFVQNGAVRFAYSVHHPGTAERPFMQQARDEGERDLAYALDYLVGAAIQRA